MRLATVQVSRVFTTGISRNKEIHLKVLIEDDSKIFGSSSIGFLPSEGCPKSPRETEITPAAAKARSAQVLRNSPRAMPLSGYELVRPEITCNESALLCVH